MAGSVSLRLLLPAPRHSQTLTLTLTPPFSPYIKPQNPSFLCFRKPRPTKSQQNLKTKENRSPKPINLPFLSPFSRFLDRIKGDGIGLEILSIALPAVLALAADPIASLVDTAFVGHLGSVELAAVGVSVSVFNLVSKLFNVPLLNVTTSFVAEQQALDSNANSDADGGDKTVRLVDGERRKFLPTVSTSLALAAGIGMFEAIALALGSGALMNIMGIPVDSPMRTPAEQFLSLRAYGAPPIVIALAAQGTFRGFMDTKTPLYAVGVGNLLNAILDPILIFILGLGVSGAAIATVISEYLIAFILLWKLNRKVILISPNIINNGIIRYLKSGALLIGRTVAVLLTMTLATSMAAREGPVPMAGHQICLQVWLAVSLLNDALALAGQGLTDWSNSWSYIGCHLVLWIWDLFVHIHQRSRSSCHCSIWSFVTISQPINAIAFVIDGLYYGVSDFAYAAYSMFFVGMVSSVFLLLAAPAFGLPGVWTGLVLFMSLRSIAGFWRLGTKSGPWKVLWSETD
ncbi:protein DETOXIFICATION 44, chloroplastic isoform X2 [Ananas comosus]|uniref:Protein DETOXIFICATION n=1 Tax=Ananas comosus TaxID=4615 RepID=A0A6P5FX07_ANACO|nr:protein DETOXIFICATION 44, chloroplastic isoform X2 [Ananas comosus]